MASVSVNRSRLYLIMLVAMFIIPMLIAWLMVGSWQPSSRVDHGQLLDPARPLPAGFATLEGEQPVGGKPIGRWTLSYIGTGGDCDDTCREVLYSMRQVRLALGRDLDRVQTWYLNRTPLAEDVKTWLDSEHPATEIGRLDQNGLAFLAEAFDDSGNIESNWIYLVDPLGNLVSRYPVTGNSKDLLTDLRRLLKYSNIG